MNFKITAFVLIYAYAFLFKNINGDTILISPVYRECGVVNLSFVQKNANVFAEILFEYNNVPAESLVPMTFIFGERKITMIINNTSMYEYRYDYESIKNMESSIQQFNRNITFQVIKMYNGNIEHSDRPLANNKVYDEETRQKLNLLESMSVWDYVKTEPVLVGRHRYTELQDYINNSPSYNKSVNTALKKAKEVIYDRIYKYALLLCIYAYEEIIVSNSFNNFWGDFKEAFEILIEAERTLDEERKRQSTLDEDWFSNSFPINPNNIKRFIRDLIQDYSTICLTPEIYGLINFATIIHSLSSESNTHIFLLRVLIYLFEDFPKPHGDDKPYNFHLIPFESDVIEILIYSICELIKTEFSVIYRIEL